MSSDGERRGGPGRTVVIALGNEDRGDDGVGPVTLRRLRPRLPRDVAALEGPADVAGLLELWDGAGRAYLIDAMRSGRPPGSVLRWERGRGTPLPVLAPTSTHALSLADAVGLGEALGRRPGALVVYAIESGRWDPGAPLSPPVERAAAEVVERLLGEIGGPPGRAPGGADADA